MPPGSSRATHHRPHRRPSRARLAAVAGSVMPSHLSFTPPDSPASPQLEPVVVPCTVRFCLALTTACLSTASRAAQTSTPVYTPGRLTPAQQTARDVFKELIEINTSVTTGNVTAGAVAMAKRFRDAGIPDSDIFIGGPRAD